MLIFIDESVIEPLLGGDPYDEETIHVLKLAAEACAQGKHFLLGSRKTLDFLRNTELLGNRERSVYTKLYNQLPQFGRIKDTLERRIEIVANSYVAQDIVCENNKVIRLPIRCFTDITTWTETILLCEHQTDCRIYKRIAEVYLAQVGLRNIPISCETRGGGGSTIVIEYDTIQQREQKFCISIVDSDKRWPYGNLGNTANSILQVDNLNKRMSELLIINPRSVENLIPTQIISELEDHNHQHTLRFLRELEDSVCGEARKHLDLKNGMFLYSVLHDYGNTECHNFWLQILQRMYLHCLSVNKQCFEYTECNTKNECKCTIIKGLGKVSELVWTRVLAKQSIHETTQALCFHTKDEWHKVGAIVSAWCCGFSPIRA